MKRDSRLSSIFKDTQLWIFISKQYLSLSKIQYIAKQGTNANIMLQVLYYYAISAFVVKYDLVQAKSIISEISNMFIIGINKYKVVTPKDRSICKYKQDTKPKGKVRSILVRFEIWLKCWL